MYVCSKKEDFKKVVNFNGKKINIINYIFVIKLNIDIRNRIKYMCIYKYKLFSL